jgi:hypothetical protein
MKAGSRSRKRQARPLGIKDSAPELEQQLDSAVAAADFANR